MKGSEKSFNNVQREIKIKDRQAMLRKFHFAILPSYCQSGVKSLEASMEAEQNNERK